MLLFFFVKQTNRQIKPNKQGPGAGGSSAGWGGLARHKQTIQTSVYVCEGDRVQPGWLFD